MTSIHFDPALFENPGEPEPREQLIVNGRYMLPPIGDPTGKRRSLQRVTNFIKQLSDHGGLERWKLRMAVIGLARDERRYDLACSLDPDSPRGKQELDALIEECIDLGQAGPSGGNVTGTALHNYTDNMGHTPTRVRAKWAPKIENYHAALHAKGLRAVPGLSERLVVSERYGTCGRLDDVYEDPFGVLRVGDRKSQKEFRTWWEIGAQLALYQGSDAMWNEQECRFEDMPVLAGDLAHVAWMPLRHPAAQTGGSIDQVTIYDIDLEGPREVLEWCLKVRTLRTEARQWGQERLDLDGFASLARDIRDAETHEDLMKLNVGLAGSDQLRAMAANRWEQIAALPQNEPVVAPSPNEQARMVSGRPLPQEEIEHRRADVMERLRESAEKAKKINATAVVTREMIEGASPVDAVAVAIQAYLDAQHEAERKAEALHAGRFVAFDPALFVAPAQDATFPDDDEAADGRGGGEVPGAGRSGEALAGLTPEQYAEAIAPLPNPLAAATREERQELQARHWVDGEGSLREPAEWLAHLGLGTSIPADPEGHWCRPMTLTEFRERYEPPRHPIATAAFGNSRGAGATVVELPAPDDEETRLQEIEQRQSSPVVPTSTDDRATAIEALDSVPIKVVREVCARANNSKSSRGRVRLLNDVEDKKYAAHGVELLPALLREWIECDGGATSTGFVKLTEGSSRQAMHESRAGVLSLTAYLEIKEAPKPASPIADHVAQVNATSNDKALERMAEGLAEKAPEFAADVAGIRKPYQGLLEGANAGKHSILRLVQLAKEAEGGHEREQVFQAIAKFHRWTGELAAEIQQHYLDNGQQLADLDAYFEAQERAEETALAEASGLPLDPDDPATAEDAVQLLESVKDRAQLALIWTQLSTKPFFGEQVLQEALLGKMVSLK